jgi:DivIVA domain-containing protein
VGLIVIVLLGVIVLVGVALLLSLGEGGLRDATVDHADLGLPDRALTADDIPRLRFRTGLRGYRMEDVDAALERITQTLRGPVPDAAPAPEVES